MKNTPDKNSGAENPPSLATTARQGKIDQPSMAGLKLLHSDFAKFAEEKEREFMPQILDQYTRQLFTWIKQSEFDFKPLKEFQSNRPEIAKIFSLLEELAKLDKQLHQFWVLAHDMDKGQATLTKIDSIMSEFNQARSALENLELKNKTQLINNVKQVEKVLKIKSRFEVKDDMTVRWPVNSKTDNIIKIIKHPLNLIRKISLANNQIGSGAVGQLAQALTSKHNKISVLDLTNNNIGDLGARSLAWTLCQTGNKLKTLFIPFNNISSDGAQAIGDTLTDKNNKLEYLQLSLNDRISRAATKAILAKADESGRKIKIEF